MDANMQLTINSFKQLFPDKIFSMTFPWHLSNSLTLPGFPDKWSPCVFNHLQCTAAYSDRPCEVEDVDPTDVSDAMAESEFGQDLGVASASGCWHTSRGVTSDNGRRPTEDNGCCTGLFTSVTAVKHKTDKRVSAFWD